ncbi:hypothetical protein CYY_000296 [Polysphondylium violaceum]|uniref:Cysteine proteinase n=1 Tax=Polysphondylium violaceum TaxID=133409 RepID=A0A8J4Q529_9MYCE|nr:hypothetical protein CYY_000296 [Polysphondylium violaceum]
MLKICTIFLLVLLCTALASATYKSPFSEQEYRQAFTEWSLKHERTYDSGEFNQRYAIFKMNMDFIHDWNSQGSQTVLGLNKFADLTNLEYRKFYLGTKINTYDYGYDGRSTDPIFSSSSSEGKENNIVDWRKKGAVTSIKDQGQCGSCWSFSTTGSVEGAHQIKTGNLVALSEQNLMDCSRAEGNMGCNGGLMSFAFNYIIKNKGIDTEESYPYKGVDEKKCLYNVSNDGATISSFGNVTQGSELSLQTAVKNHGPVSVAIDASHNSFQLYTSGIYYESKCSSTQLDHGVLVVGYGTMSKTSKIRVNNRLSKVVPHQETQESSSSDDTTNNQYWIVKNSWGTTWGEQGYILMSKNRRNNCGIASQASYPII